MDLTPEVQEAICEVLIAYSDNKVTIEPDGQGGAYVVVQELFLGDQYLPSTSWVGFHIGFQYPRSDVYPHFISSDVTRADGRAHGNGFSGPNEWQGRRALQISRRSNRWDPTVDTAVGKLMKVLEWVRTQ